MFFIFPASESQFGRYLYLAAIVWFLNTDYYQLRKEVKFFLSWY